MDVYAKRTSRNVDGVMSWSDTKGDKTSAYSSLIS